MRVYKVSLFSGSRSGCLFSKILNILFLRNFMSLKNSDFFLILRISEISFFRDFVTGSS